MKKALKVILTISSVIGVLYGALKAWAYFYIMSPKSSYITAT